MLNEPSISLSHAALLGGLSAHQPSIMTHLLRAPLAELTLIQMPQLIHLRRLAGHNTLRHLNRPTDRSLAANSILRRLARDLDNADARVLGSTIVLAVAEVTQPRFEGRRVVLAHLFAVGFDFGAAGDRGPLAGAVDEADVYLGVLGQIVGLAGFGVGVEEEVYAVAFLLWMCQ